MLRTIRFITLITFTVLIIFSCQQSTDVEAEKEVIKELIKSETKLGLERKPEEFAELWVHEPYALWVRVSKENYWEDVGWDSISYHGKMWMKSKPPREEKFINKDYIIKLYDDCAWVTFEKYFESDKVKDSDFKPERGLRVLEKKNGKWKIVFVGSINKNSYRTKHDTNLSNFSNDELCAVGQSFLDVLEDRDFEKMERYFQSDIKGRFMSLKNFGKFSGSQEVAQLFRKMFGEAETFIIEQSDVNKLSNNKIHISYRFRVSADTYYEQRIYAVVKDNLIESMVLLCSGSFKPPLQ